VTTPLRDALTQRINQVGPAHPDIEELVGLGEQRLRRRRLTAVAGAGAFVALAIALAIGGTALNRSADQNPGPIHRPPTNPHQTQTTTPTTTRQIVYSDHKIGTPGDTVHFGDRAVETGNDEVHLDVTDDGFLYTDRGGVWFSDGGTPEQVGSHLCAGLQTGEFGHFANRAVMSANSGSTVAWFDCTHQARPTLVVFDTSSRQEVARRPVAFCKEFCELVDVTDESVYLNRGVYTGAPLPEYRFDLRANRLRASTPQEYAEDLRSQPRGLILGDDWQIGTPITGVGRSPSEDGPMRFDATGSRLIPVVSVNDRDQATSAFDTATRRVLRLRLPPGYHVGTTATFRLFNWLDDDTIALVGGRGDILTCQLSTGRCVLAVPGPDADTWRIVPGFPLPG
jgi:hypothetical protein